ncbi:glucose-6-phosphate dehydrogenase [Candidatus Peregrinibacteria bacterium]|nr:glucose-6-phosphate dehydrogenase [Candidatus Peregrinibacteria bacterium]
MVTTIKKPFIISIFGASGNLAAIKIYPTLYELMEKGLLPSSFAVIGYARSSMTNQEFRAFVTKSIRQNYKKKINNKVLNSLLKKTHYIAGNYNNLDDFKHYRKQLGTMLKKKKLTNICYFAVPPIVFKDIIKNLALSRKSENEDIRLVLEKPFGDNASSARDLFHFVSRYFEEENIYLLDHYLGKSVVQSILSLRESNRILNLIMRGPEVANIQITAFETVGVENRIGYFEKVGTLKDMIQSHLLQVLSLITMSIPVTNIDTSLHREKNSILSAIKFSRSKKNIVLGQYKGYTDNEGVKKNSRTDTFAALRLFIDRQSWYKVPIYIRTGKRLHEHHTYIVIELKKHAFQPASEPPNRIVLEFFPDERINIKLVNRHGHTLQYQDITTSDTIACEDDSCLPEHGVLIRDVIAGRKRFFLSFPEVIATWELIDSIIKFSHRNNVPIESYAPGSYGPQSQNKITRMDGFEWYDIH